MKTHANIHDAFREYVEEVLTEEIREAVSEALKQTFYAGFNAALDALFPPERRGATKAEIFAHAKTLKGEFEQYVMARAAHTKFGDHEGEMH